MPTNALTTAEALRAHGAQVMTSAMEGRCTQCLRIAATDHDWDTTAEGERPDLCWDDEGSCHNLPEANTTREELQAQALAAWFEQAPASFTPNR